MASSWIRVFVTEHAKFLDGKKGDNSTPYFSFKWYLWHGLHHEYYNSDA